MLYLLRYFVPAWILISNFEAFPGSTSRRSIASITASIVLDMGGVIGSGFSASALWVLRVSVRCIAAK